jgi:hypothetical protein
MRNCHVMLLCPRLLGFQRRSSHQLCCLPRGGWGAFPAKTWPIRIQDPLERAKPPRGPSVGQSSGGHVWAEVGLIRAGRRVRTTPLAKPKHAQVLCSFSKVPL